MTGCPSTSWYLILILKYIYNDYFIFSSQDAIVQCAYQQKIQYLYWPLRIYFVDFVLEKDCMSHINNVLIIICKNDYYWNLPSTWFSWTYELCLERNIHIMFFNMIYVWTNSRRHLSSESGYFTHGTIVTTWSLGKYTSSRDALFYLLSWSISHINS